MADWQPGLGDRRWDVEGAHHSVHCESLGSSARVGLDWRAFDSVRKEGEHTCARTPPTVERANCGVGSGGVGAGVCSGADDGGKRRLVARVSDS